jgi:hypothetical protein
MKRMEAVMAWFSTCLGITLLAASVLVVPGNAFADNGTTCAAKALSICGSNQGCYYYEIGYCCLTDCGNDSTCASTCCKSACGSDSTCLSNCLQAQLSCLGMTCDNGCANQWDLNLKCDNANTSCTKMLPASCGTCLCLKQITATCSCKAN